MKSYIFGRLIRSIISIFIVVSIVVLMVFLGLPEDYIFKNDQILTKLGGKVDEQNNYKYGKLKQLGYSDFLLQYEMCRLSDDFNACMDPSSAKAKEIKDLYISKGYTVQDYVKSSGFFAVKRYNAFEILLNFYTRFIQIDHPNKIQDPNNPDLERKIEFTLDHNNIPAIRCSGCENRYLLYFDTSFPFIHQNFITFDLGYSHPTYANIKTFNVITNGQGNLKNKEVTFETGVVQNSAINLHKCRYRDADSITRLDRNKFNSNYADCKNNYTSPSMIGTSYIFGISSLIFAYLIAIPSAIYMARKRGKWQDKIGIIYINIMIAVPSLAFIFFAKSIGHFFGLPEKFGQLGFNDIRSYIQPIIILGLLSTAGLMIWVRRYMIDQANSDYVKFAKAKGLNEKEIFNKHIFRNAIIPLVNGIPGSIILAISGALITETIFGIPGMGKMLPDAINAGNNTMVITLALIYTSLSIFSLLIGDILMCFVDPRIQLNNKGGSR